MEITTLSRLDQVIVERGLARTRSQAKLLIDEGLVEVNGQITHKASYSTKPEDQINLLKTHQYVGRAAAKLQAALSEFSICLDKLVIADIGASTGGFTQVAIEQGASRIYCIDVGHGQLAPELKKSSKVINLEGLNAKYPFELAEKMDLCVMDVSFISCRKILLNLRSLLKIKNLGVILLFKPQFEQERAGGTNKGIVPAGQLAELLDNFEIWCTEKEIKVSAKTQSPILGKEGNQEFLYHLSFRD